MTVRRALRAGGWGSCCITAQRGVQRAGPQFLAHSVWLINPRTNTTDHVINQLLKGNHHAGSSKIYDAINT